MPGGPPIRVFRPRFPAPDRIATYLEQIAASGQYSNGGPLVRALEARLAEHFGVAPECVVVCTSGTTALEGAVATSGARRGVWEVPSWTFTATPSAVLRSGAEVRFVDVDVDQRAVFSSTPDAFIDVLPFGAGPAMERLPHGAATLVDAAASFDACRTFPFPNDRRVALMVSLHATKSMPAGEGGVLVSNDPEWAMAFRRWINFGMWGSRRSLEVGTNGKMSEITAAVAHASLDLWEECRAEWLAQADRARAATHRLGLRSPGAVGAGTVTPYWNVQFADAAERDAVIDGLASAGIETLRWWGDGCHVMPAYQGIPSAELPVTAEFGATVVGLPFHLDLSPADFDRIEATIEHVFGSRR